MWASHYFLCVCNYFRWISSCFLCVSNCFRCACDYFLCVYNCFRCACDYFLCVYNCFRCACDYFLCVSNYFLCVYNCFRCACDYFLCVYNCFRCACDYFLCVYNCFRCACDYFLCVYNCFRCACDYFLCVSNYFLCVYNCFRCACDYFLCVYNCFRCACDYFLCVYNCFLCACDYFLCVYNCFRCACDYFLCVYNCFLCVCNYFRWISSCFPCVSNYFLCVYNCFRCACDYFLCVYNCFRELNETTVLMNLKKRYDQELVYVGNLGLLFMLLFFIYAALGVELFGKLECSEENPCEGLSRHATFQNFGMAFLTLFSVSTGDNWNGIMKDTLRDCRPEDRSCLSYLPLVSPVYFVTFVLTAQFVLVNVVVAVLMKHLEESNKEAQEEAEEEAKEEEARQEEARQQEARQEEARQEAINATVGGVESSGQVVEEERCRGSLLTAGRPSLSRMMSLPSDSYMLRPLQPLRHTRYPPIGHDTYKGCGFSGSVYSMGSSGAGSLLQVPGALPSGSHASLSSRGSSCRPTVRLSPSHSVDRHSSPWRDTPQEAWPR
ncbi:uncharacterized protein LOC135560297 [Oncorhynchus nerka]|uniref:uncharacterized protein LOC135560297 n=1 Tax=Oncorhynchus nerka TaxID=8023 RepID=UPI0031B881F7